MRNKNSRLVVFRAAIRSLETVIRNLETAKSAFLQHYIKLKLQVVKEIISRLAGVVSLQRQE
jgi:hypothetical protein